MAILYAVLILLIPAVLKWAEPKYKFFQVISPVIACYGIGMLFGNVKALGLDLTYAQEIGDAAIPLAMALLLFSSNFAAWLKTGGKALLSFLCCMVAVSVVVAIASKYFSEGVEEPEKIGAMMIGVYTGGTANLNAIGKSLEMPETIFALLNGYDTVLSSLYLLFAITIGQAVLHWFLPKYKSEQIEQHNETEPQVLNPIGFLKSLGMAAICLGISLAFSMIVFGEMKNVVVIIGTTTLAIAGSFLKTVRNLKESYPLGDYFILVACMGFGFKTNFEMILNSGGAIFYFCTLVLIGSILVHYLLAAILRIDADTVLVTSISAIFGPAFVGLVSSRLKNPELIAPGISTGLIGYAVANYLGIAMAALLT
ncbi:MAG: DUF819 family protein [Bacteroidetes bacterium]|nr:DUF819 family protein [Bacteroidota bacterium]